MTSGQGAGWGCDVEMMSSGQGAGWGCDTEMMTSGQGARGLVLLRWRGLRVWRRLWYWRGKLVICFGPALVRVGVEIWWKIGRSVHFAANTLHYDKLVIATAHNSRYWSTTSLPLGDAGTLNFGGWSQLSTRLLQPATSGSVRGPGWTRQVC